MRNIFSRKKSLDNGQSQINFDEALRLKSRSKVDQIQTLSMMLKIRIVENKLADMRKIAALAKQHGIITVVDNTCATPWIQRPLELGIDIVIHIGIDIGIGI